MILFLHPADEFYGADRVALSVVARLRESEELRVWLPTDIRYPRAPFSRTLGEKGVPVEFVDLPVLRRAYFTPRGTAATVGRALRLRGLLRSAGADALYVNTTALAPVIPVARSLGIPVDVHVHEAFGAKERRVIGPLMLPARRIIVVSDSVRRGLPRRLGERAEVIRHTISDPVRPVDRAGADTLRASMGLAPTDTVVLLASRWSPAKGVPVVVDALARARRPDVHLVIAGGPPPSGRAVDVAGQATQSPVASQIHVVGELADMRGWLAAADAVAVPSVFPDPYPTIALEAVAAGLPVLASNTGGLPEIVTPGAGNLLPPGDVAAWSRALSDLPRRDQAVA
ncbi:MAG: glycosyltransferase family 4 protein [Candidatus Nanopelagicales bacterium]